MPALFKRKLTSLFKRKEMPVPPRVSELIEKLEHEDLYARPRRR